MMENFLPQTIEDKILGKKVEKSSKIRQDNKSLISTSAFLLTAIAEV